ncbi:Uncharacterized protein DAT39_005096, partial [Clarias magur]
MSKPKFPSALMMQGSVCSQRNVSTAMFIRGPDGAGVQPGVKVWVSLDAKALKK